MHQWKGVLKLKIQVLIQKEKYVSSPPKIFVLHLEKCNSDLGSK